MTFRRLINSLDVMTALDDTRTLRNDKIVSETAAKPRTIAFLLKGTVLEVSDSSNQIQVDGYGTVTAQEIPDEPLFPGQIVWVSQVEGGDAWVIHGSVKG